MMVAAPKRTQGIFPKLLLVIRCGHLRDTIGLCEFVCDYVCMCAGGKKRRRRRSSLSSSTTSSACDAH